jgi:hypothetical protein
MTTLIVAFFFCNFANAPKIFLPRLSDDQQQSGFGGLWVSVLSSGTQSFAGSNRAEAVGFLRAEKSSARLPSEGK